MKQSMANLVLKTLPASTAAFCDSTDILHTALTLLQQDGGIYISSNVILSHVPRDLGQQTLWSAFSSRAHSSRVTYGVVIASRGFNESVKDTFIRQVKSSAAPSCVSPGAFAPSLVQPNRNIHCVFVPDTPEMYPKDIMYANTSFAELSRWLFYGKRSPIYPKTIPGSIPRICHLIWFSRDASSSTELKFYQFVTLLSTLYVGGFDRVYVHGNREFTGPWWQRLKGENITFVIIEDPETVFQQKMAVVEHKSDIMRSDMES